MKINNTNAKEVPVSKNMDLELSVHSLDASGQGIGRYEGFTVMVRGALPEETCLVHIIKVYPRYAVGKLVKVLTPSKDRVAPACAYQDKCGGCPWIHLAYPKQLEQKRENVLSLLRRIGKFGEEELPDQVVEAVRGMENPWHYRNKAQFPAGSDNGRLCLGFYAPHSHRLIPVKDCLIQQDRTNALMKEIESFASSMRLKPYDETTGKGLLRHVLIRLNEQLNEVSVCLVLASDRLPEEAAWIAKMKSLEVDSFSININRKATNVILGNETKVLFGNPYIQARIGDLTYHVAPTAFFQVNSKQVKVLYDQVKDLAQLTGEEILWDAYCGAGTISLYLASQAKAVYGVEIVPEAIDNAVENAKLNGIENASFFVGKSEEVIPAKLSEGLRADIVVVDPPRSGCDKALLTSLLQMQPEKIIYVSCDPATLARDLDILCHAEAYAYQIKAVRPVDMFPMTGHIETVVQLSKGRWTSV